jgi:hypothetical protein
MNFFIPDHRIMVRVPAVECLLGDKLTAFAPTTLGLPYDNESPVALIKQLFDIGQLFDVATDLPLILDSYERVFISENSYRNNRYTKERALADSYEAALTLSSIDLTKNIDNEHASILQAGVRNIAPLLVTRSFTLSEAKTAAAKVALISRIILYDRRDIRFEHFRFNQAGRGALAAAAMERPLEFLTKLRGVNDEAFHYWRMLQTIFRA